MPVGFVCPECEAVQSLPSDSDYTLLLGFGGRPDIDEAALRDRYYALSRKLHPDRFQTGTAEDQRASVQATALLNAAFRTLKDVESRGRWWLEHVGESLGRDNNRVPPALASVVFDVQEKIAERLGATGPTRQRLDGELQTVHAELADRLDAQRAGVETLLRTWPTDETLDTAAVRLDLKRALSELSYLRTLVRDVRHALED